MSRVLARAEVSLSPRLVKSVKNFGRSASGMPGGNSAGMAETRAGSGKDPAGAENEPSSKAISVRDRMRSELPNEWEIFMTCICKSSCPPCPLPAPVKAKPLNKRGDRDQG